MGDEKGGEGTAGNPVDVSTIPMIVPIQIAWARVMGEIQQIAKGDQTQATGKYMYRGVDRVVNEVGPVLRKHGVMVIPLCESIEHRDVTTSGGKHAHEVIVKVGYTIIGPEGPGAPTLYGSAFGESADSNDKATPQAMSVAWRTFLIQALTVPTGDPDPDENDFQRGSQQRSSATTSDRSSQRPATEPKADEPAVDVTALGWKTVEDQTASWKALLEAQRNFSKEHEAELIDWGREQKLNPKTFTTDQANALNERINAAMQAERVAADAAAEVVKDAFPGATTTQGMSAAYADDEAPF